MKRKRGFFIVTLLLGMLAGCSKVTAEPDFPILRERTYPETRGGLAVTQSCDVLARIWSGYIAGERFAVFGGDPRNSVSEGPGDLDITDSNMLQKRFFLTPDLTDQITEGAALEHLLNRNVFCTGVFRLAEGADAIQFTLQLRNALENTQWSGGRPQRYLIAQPEQGFLLLAYGQTSALDTFLIRMNQAYPKGQILAYQEIPQKIPPHDLRQADRGTVLLDWKSVIEDPDSFGSSLLFCDPLHNILHIRHFRQHICGQLQLGTGTNQIVLRIFDSKIEISI